MKIAVWRYGMSFQTAEQSTVGGGLLAERVLDRLIHLGHEPALVGPVARDSKLAHFHKPTTNLKGYDAAVILTGPFNPMYGDAAFDTYRRLARFSGRALYLQWDVALPFRFDAMLSKKVSELARVSHEDVTANKQWFVLTQTSEADLRKKKCYASAPFTHVPCLFELEQLHPSLLLPVNPQPEARLAYCGSDRPQRVREVQRYLCANDSPPSVLFGRWSEKNLRELAMLSMQSPAYSGTIPELAVTRTLNRFASTLYIADNEYVKTDFIAQRFFENAAAAVPVIYGDSLQPSIAAVVPLEWVAQGPKELAERCREIELMDGRKRKARVEDNRRIVQAVAQEHQARSLTNALRRALS